MSANHVGRDLPNSPSPSPPPPQGAHASSFGPVSHTAAVPQATGSEGAAPPDPDEAVRAELESNVRTVMDQLFGIASYVVDVPQNGEGGVQQRVQNTVRSLDQMMRLAPRITHQIPEDVVELIDTGRNPDQHTRQNLTRLANDNQQMLGQNMALGEYREQLQAALERSFPELNALLEPGGADAWAAPAPTDAPSINGSSDARATSLVADQQDTHL